MLILAALALAAPQNTIERTFTDSAYHADTRTASPGLASGGGEQILLVSRVSFPSAWGLPKARLLQVSVSGSALVASDLSVVGINPGGTDLRLVEVGTIWACGSGCIWGPYEPYIVGSGGLPHPVAQGQQEDLSTALFLPFSAGAGMFTMPFNEWEAVQRGPTFDVQIGIGNDWRSTEPGSSTPTNVDLLNYEVRAVTEVSGAATYELDATDSVGYCDSQDNATTRMATIRAYGSRDAGTPFLSIRVNDVPQGAAGILFAASAPASVPGATSTLCVGGAIQRVGGVQVATAGFLQFDIDLIGRLPGSIVYFQSYFRDPIYSVCASEGALVRVQ